METVWGNREQWNCGTVLLNSVVEQCGGIAEQYGGTKEQCD